MKFSQKKITQMKLLKIFLFQKIACESPKYALKSSNSTIHRVKKRIAVFKSAFDVFWHFFMLNLAFSGYWHLATLKAKEAHVSSTLYSKL
jgi:hypothetical protein